MDAGTASTRARLPRPPLPAAGSPGARCQAGCRPGPRSSVTPAGPRGRGRGGGPGRPHLLLEAGPPAGSLPWRPRRPALPRRQPGVLRPEERSLQPAATDAQPRRPQDGPCERPGANWEMSRRKREGCLRRPPRHPQGLGARLDARPPCREGRAAAPQAPDAIGRFRLPAPPPAAFPPLRLSRGRSRPPPRVSPSTLNGKSPQKRPSQCPSIPRRLVPIGVPEVPVRV